MPVPADPAAVPTVPDAGTAAPAGASPRRLRAIPAARAAAVTALCCALVLAALLAPPADAALTVRAFTRLPVEAIVVAALVLALPPRPGRLLAGLSGAVIGVLAVGRLLDAGFTVAFARPFDPVLDGVLLADSVDFFEGSLGRAGAIAVLVGVAVVAVAVPVLMTLAVLRLGRLVREHRARSARVVTAAAIAWLTLAAVGVQSAPGQPVAAHGAVTMAVDRVQQVRAGLHDRAVFAQVSAQDAFAEVPAAQLLTGLRGKDVLLTFVESYGRNAVEDPRMAPQVDALLDEGTAQLRAAGFAARSAFLTSPTTGGGSWFAHSTLQSGLWIDNQDRYRTLVTTDRLTLSRAFHDAGWRTVAVMPEVTMSWPEGAFYDFDHVYDSQGLAYRGPRFGYPLIPDQYTLATFQRDERATPGHAPVMAELALISSHSPWSPRPRLLDWTAMGDGSVFDGMPDGQEGPATVLADGDRARDAYRQTIEYSLGALISYVRTYGDDNLVLVVLGDHQPAALVVGDGASHDVPISIIARDPAVLDRVAGWGWTDGLRPASSAPVWRMDAFRNRFLTAFSGPTPSSPTPSGSLTSGPAPSAGS